MYGRNIYPIGKHHCPISPHTLTQGKIQHASGNGRHHIKTLKDETLQPQHQALEPRPLEQTQIKSRVDLVILHMQPSGCAGQSCGQPCAGGRNEGRCNHPNHIRPPENLPQHRRKAGKGKGFEMNQTLQTRRANRHPKRATRYLNPGRNLLLIASTGITRPNCPSRVIRRRCHHPYRMALSRKPCSHLAAVFADAGEFGSVVEGTEEDFH